MKKSKLKIRIKELKNEVIALQDINSAMDNVYQKSIVLCRELREENESLHERIKKLYEEATSLMTCNENLMTASNESLDDDATKLDLIDEQRCRLRSLEITVMELREEDTRLQHLSSTMGSTIVRQEKDLARSLEEFDKLQNLSDCQRIRIITLEGALSKGKP